MNAIRTIWAELLALFVDDGRLAFFVVGWVGLWALVLPRLPPGARGLALFAGLAAILVESARRGARPPPLRNASPPST